MSPSQQYCFFTSSFLYRYTYINIDRHSPFVLPFFYGYKLIGDQEKKRKKSGFMDEGTVGRSSERLESGLPPKLMEDFVPMVPFFCLLNLKFFLIFLRYMK